MNDEIKIEQISMSMTELNKLLIDWKKKGAERAFMFVFFGSLPLAFIAPFIIDGITKDKLLIACISYFYTLSGAAMIPVD